MLELRPTCEHCNRNLPPESTDAVICSFECTFCRDCADGLLAGVCPNCGGGFSARPIRPRINHRGDNFLGKYPASTQVKHRPADLDTHREFAERVGRIPAPQR
ncbi:MAG: DUF1272 domain-containing protein [Burkholderiales bacterium]|nr:DUF1272 domain-containing protein [Burkholderiales bacterium]